MYKKDRQKERTGLGMPGQIKGLTVGREADYSSDMVALGPRWQAVGRQQVERRYLISPLGHRGSRRRRVTSLHLPAVVISTCASFSAVPRRYTVLPCISRRVYPLRNPILTDPVLAVDEAYFRRVGCLLYVTTAGLVPRRGISRGAIHRGFPCACVAVRLWLPRTVWVPLGLHEVVLPCCLPSTVCS